MYLNKMNEIHPLSWSCQSNLHLIFGLKNINKPLDGAYSADFGTGITPIIGSYRTDQFFTEDTIGCTIRANTKFTTWKSLRRKESTKFVPPRKPTPQRH